MKRQRLFSSASLQCLGAVLLVAATAGALLLLGGRRPDRVLVALGYILPVGWSAARWGRWPGACAALTALLADELFFVQPAGTRTLAWLAGWLLLAALLASGNWLADRLQATLARPQDRIYEEYYSAFVHGLRAALAELRTLEEVSTTLTAYLRQLLQAELVEVQVRTGSPMALMVRSGAAGRAERVPDRIVPLPGTPGLAGEIRLWGDGYLPPEDSYLLRSLAAQGTWALALALRPEVALHQDAPALVEPGDSVNTGGVPAHGNRATPQS